MQITPVNSKINFGYSKKLDNELKEKLNTNPQSPMNQTLLQINDVCNFCENQIRNCERKGTIKYYRVINLLSKFLIDAKCYLYRQIEYLYPELDYARRDIEHYDEESYRITDKTMDNATIQEVINSNPQLLQAHTWRDDLGCKYDEMTEYEAEQDAQSYTIYTYEQEPSLNSSAYGTAGKSGRQPLIEKYIPSKTSPKSLDDVVGIKDIVQDVEDLIIYPLEHKEEAKKREEEYGIEIPHFIVFHGPPGCGKTMLAQAIAAKSGCDMYKMDLSTVGSTYINGTVLNIKSGFEELKKIASKSEKPVILFMDEMDSMYSKRSEISSSEGGLEDNKVVNALLVMINEAIENNIIIIGATNMYDSLDSAVKRRINLNSYIGLPDKEEIKTLLEKLLSKFSKGKPIMENKKDLEELSSLLVGFSPDNISKLIIEASKIAYRKNRELSKEDFIQAVKITNIEKIDEKKYLPKSKRPAKNIGFSYGL